MTILRRWGAGQDHPGLVLHSFSGDMAMAEEMEKIEAEAKA